jgi:hypothetical protein
LINVKGDVKADGNFQDTPEDGKHATAEETRRAARTGESEAAMPQRNLRTQGSVRTQGHFQGTKELWGHRDIVRTQEML